MLSCTLRIKFGLVALLLCAPVPLLAKDSLFVYEKTNGAFVDDNTKLYLAIPGVHHSVSMGFPFARWVGVFIDDRYPMTRKVDIKLYRTVPRNDPSYFHLEFTSKGKVATPIFCVANLPETTQVVTYLHNYRRLLQVSQVEYHVSEMGTNFVISKKPLASNNRAVLSISAGEQRFVFDTLAGPDIYWVGKLNADYAPDLIVCYEVEAGYEYRLYVSLPGPNLDYRIVSTYRTGGI